MGAELPVLLSALVLGFAGSVHCLGMCGGIAGALTQAAPARGPIVASVRTLLYSIGRIASYAMAGALVGSFGAFFAGVPTPFGLIRFAVGLVIVVIGLQIAFAGRLFAPLERAGLSLWRLASPLARRIGRPERAWQFLALGLLWGWLPCGLVYSGLVMAAASGSAVTGAIAMACFGVGTLPAVWAVTGFGAALARLGGGASVRRSAGIALVCFGLWSIVGTWIVTGHHAGHHVGHDAGPPTAHVPGEAGSSSGEPTARAHSPTQPHAPHHHP